MEETRAKRSLRNYAGLEGEILQEIAEALGNAGEKVERALDQLRAVADRIEALRGGLDAASESPLRTQIRDRLREELEQYHLLRREAMAHYRHLVIHREAVGFRNHKLMQEQYRIPPPIEAPDD